MKDIHADAEKQEAVIKARELEISQLQARGEWNDAQKQAAIVAELRQELASVYERSRLASTELSRAQSDVAKVAKALDVLDADAAVAAERLALQQQTTAATEALKNLKVWDAPPSSCCRYLRYLRQVSQRDTCGNANLAATLPLLTVGGALLALLPQAASRCKLQACNASS